MDVTDRIVEKLREHGPMLWPAAAGLCETSLRDSARVLADPRIYSVRMALYLTADVLDGRCFTAPAPSGDVLPLAPDLAVLEEFAGPIRARLPGGREVDATVDVRAMEVRGPKGWMQGLERGRIVVCILDATERLVEVEPADASAAVDEATAARVRETLSGLDVWSDPKHEPMPDGNYLHFAVRVLVAEHPELFGGPGPTLREIVEAAGFEVYRDRVVVPPGADIEAWDAELDTDWEAEDAEDESNPQALALLRTIPGFGPHAERMMAICRADEPPDLAELDELFRVHDARARMFSFAKEGAERLDAVADAVLEAHPTHPGALTAKAAVAWARADADTAEYLLRTVCATDPEPMAAEHLADLLSERGDAAGALAAYRAAGLTEDDYDVQLLLCMVAPSRWRVGRNTTCPCGSGRKFKRCCGDPNATKALSARFPWVLRKTLKFTAMDRKPSSRWAEAMFGRVGLDEVDEPLVLDAALYASHDGEEPCLYRFLRERGHRLPSDERELVEQWVHTELTLAEVVDSDSRGLSVRLIPADAIVRVGGGYDLAPGEVGLTRLLPDGKTVQPAFWYPVDPSELKSVQDTVGEGHLAVSEVLFPATPERRTTDGQILVFVRREWTVRSGIEDMLNERFTPRGESVWEVLNSRGEVTATLTRSGSTLVVEADAFERAAAVEALLSDRLEELIDDTTTDPHEPALHRN